MGNNSFYSGQTAYEEIAESESILAEVRTLEAAAEDSKEAAAASAASAAASASTATTASAAASTDAATASAAATTATAEAAEAETFKDAAETAMNSAISSALTATAAKTDAEAAEAAAQASATQAASDAALVATIYDTFDDRYLGAKASAPTLDNDGDALLVGARYFDTTLNGEYVWNGATWLATAGGGDLLAANNLSDVASAATAFTNISYGSIASQAEAEAGTDNAKMMTPLRTGQAIYARAPAGHLNGLTVSRTATQTITVAPGVAASDDASPRAMRLTSSIAKTLNNAWAVGDGNGGLDTGAVADGTYHVWLIMRSDTGVVDVLCSASASAPTMPANYDHKRRICSIIRSGGAIRDFVQHGDLFKLVTGVVDRNSTAAATSAPLTLTVPTGIIVRPVLRVFLVASLVTATCYVLLGDAAAGSGGVKTVAYVTTPSGSDIATSMQIVSEFVSNTSAQIYFEQSNSVGAPTESTLVTLGWIDTRGR